MVCCCEAGGTRSPASNSETSLDVCMDSVEMRALACSAQSARRNGDTLFLRLASGRETTFVDDQTSEAPGGYRYAGRIGRAGLHAIEQYGHETAPVWIFINVRTGRHVVAADKPILSPDTSRFATASESWNNCTELDHPRLDIWRLTDSLPALEWRLDPWSCTTGSGWGPTDPTWLSRDTLRFTRNDMEFSKSEAAHSAGQPVYRKRTMLAARDRRGWRITSQP